MNTRPSGSAGFTLVELLITLGIMSLVLVVAVAARPNTASTRVAVAARSVAATLQLARARAMSKNVETVVYFDVSKSEFGTSAARHSLPERMSVALTVAEMERAGDSGGFRFYPDGQSSGGEVLLKLDGRSARIAVNWLTGEPRLTR